MKELSIEEKAKRYDEALARANEMIKDMTNMGGVAKVDDIQYIFPELKESEDERIRKGLIEYFLHYPDHEITYYGLKADFVISWLEKQGENNMGISEATKQKLEDNLNKALEKETAESYNEFLEKQGEQKPRYSIGDVLCDKSCTTLNKESQSNFEIIDIRNEMYICDKCSFPISQQDEYELVAKSIESVWSEEDEKMRNVAIDACKYMVDNFENSTKQYEDAIAWLEKQCTPAKLSEEEQNKFAKGVLTSCALSFIDYLDAHKYEDKMCVSNGECEDIENAFHNAMWDRLHRYYCKYIEKQGEQKPVEEKIWSINDAKDGDVLNSVRVQATIIFKGFADDDKHILAYCGLQKGIFISQEILWDRDFEPASEYWKNALYDAMTARGYEWDADRLELKKIEQKPADDIERKYNPCYNMPFKKAQEYISNRGFDIPWTNCDVFVDFRYVTQTVANILRWADNNPKQNPAWSEDDENRINRLIAYFEDKESFTAEDDVVYANWLKSLKNRVQPQPKQEWSEEDEVHQLHTISLVEDLREWANKDGMHSLCLERCAESIDWLKSLRPQNTWKPSESDIRILEQVIDGTVNPINYHATLYAILEQLKKLRE